MMLKRICLALFIFCGASLNAKMQSDISVQWFVTSAERTAEFCRTSWPASTSTCTLSERPTADVSLPSWLGKIVEAHVQQAARLNAFDELSGNDFYHGHFILRGPADHFATIQNFFSNVVALLYHTAEFNNRWETEHDLGVPLNQRRPRSLLGFLDGRLQPAANYVRHSSNAFERSGTIYDTDILADNAELSEFKESFPPIFVQLEGHNVQMYSLQFYIVPQAEGRFHTLTGEAFELFIRGVENPEETQLRFYSVPRE